MRRPAVLLLGSLALALGGVTAAHVILNLGGFRKALAGRKTARGELLVGYLPVT